jgi:hypothetical protein
MSSVDVVVPCYRYGHYLRECVESVLGQSIRDVRVLIIDDASPDNTADVSADLVREDPRVTFIRHSVNKGHIATYNEGLLDWAEAKYSLLLSADDYILPGALGRATNLMDAHPEVGLTFGNYIELDDDSTETPVRRVFDPTRSLDKVILQGETFIELSGAANLVGTCTAVVRTQLQKKLGGYRAELPHTGDMEMWLRFAGHAPVGIINAFQGVYRRHQANMSSSYYSTAGRLSELHQRKAAVDCFLENRAGSLPDFESVREGLLRSLANIAIKHASFAFNDGETQASKKLAEFALGICPQIDKSASWLKLTLKQRMGSRAWRALHPAVAAIRSLQPQR